MAARVDKLPEGDDWMNEINSTALAHCFPKTATA
jgi:hypothetical protein